MRLGLAGAALVIVLTLAIAQVVASWNNISSDTSSPAVVATTHPGASNSPKEQPATTPVTANTDNSGNYPTGATPSADSTPSPTTAPPTRTPTPPPAGPIVHVVASGETLLVIAARYGTAVDAITRANGISSTDQLSIGQKLIIPPATNR